MDRARGLLAAAVMAGGCYTGSDVDAVWVGGGPGSAGGEGGDEDPPADTGGQDDGPAATDCTEVAATPLMRLTPRQYTRAVRDALGLSAMLEVELPAAEKVGAFDAVTSSAGDLEVRKLLDAAEAAAERVLTDGQSVVACENEDDACAEAFIETLGRRAFRRPLDDAQRQMLWDWYEHGREDGGTREGYAQVVRGVLQSPAFLYHVQIGQPDPQDELRLWLDDYEIASRLSFFLWESGPDALLLDAAERGELRDASSRAEQAQRMLADPRASEAVASFHQQWLRTDRTQAPDHLAQHTSDPEAIWAAMQAEVAAFTAAAAREGDSEVLFNAQWSVMPPELADFYGIPPEHRSTTENPALVRVEYPDGDRGGLLTLGGVMVATAASVQTSPILRGVFVVENIMCTHLAPPEDLEIDPLPERREDQSVRDWLDAHTAEPACAACHNIIDPPGFAMEDFGPDGRWRDHDGLFPVDAAAQLGADAVDGAHELSVALGSDDIAANCRATQWVQFATGRPTKTKSCGTQVVAAAASGSLDDVVDAIVRDETFTYRRLPQDHE